MIKCEKCGSIRVDHYMKNPPEEKVWSIDDVAKGRDRSYVTTLQIKGYDMILECRSCGYIVEYIERRPDH